MSYPDKPEKPRRKHGESLWRETIEAFRAANPQAQEEDDLRRLLERLAVDPGASDAFCRLGLKSDWARHAIVVSCLDAHILARDFGAVVAAEKRMKTSLRLLEKSVAALKSFVEIEVVKTPEELSRQFRGGLQVRTLFAFEDVEAMRRGLGAIELAMKYRRRTAEETILRWGTTKKTAGPAGITAAVGYFGEAVRNVCGRAHEAAAAELVSAVLEVETSVDRLHSAERTRRRPWR